MYVVGGDGRRGELCFIPSLRGPGSFPLVAPLSVLGTLVVALMDGAGEYREGTPTRNHLCPKDAPLTLFNISLVRTSNVTPTFLTGDWEVKSSVCPGRREQDGCIFMASSTLTGPFYHSLLVGIVWEGIVTEPPSPENKLHTFFF